MVALPTAWPVEVLRQRELCFLSLRESGDFQGLVAFAQVVACERDVLEADVGGKGMATETQVATV